MGKSIFIRYKIGKDEFCCQIKEKSKRIGSSMRSGCDKNGNAEKCVCICAENLEAPKITTKGNTNNNYSYRKCKTICVDEKMQELNVNLNSNYSYRNCNTIYVYEKMEELNVNLISATNYLIQLFYKTDKKYVCTRTKIGKLLSIVAFRYAIDGKKLFNEKICPYPNVNGAPNPCGTMIDGLEYIIENEVYPVFDNKPNDGSINPSDIYGKDDVIPARFMNTGNLSDDIQKVIKDVFLHFGAYDPKKLGEWINKVVEDKVTNNQIDLTLFKGLTIKGYNNPIIEYLFNIAKNV